MTQITQAPSAVSNNSSSGSDAWTDYNNVKIDDASVATWAGGGDTTSYLLKCIFDFSAIPPNDENTLTIINSITFNVHKYADSNGSSNNIKDFYVKLFHSDGIVVGTDFAKTARWGTSESTSTYTVDSTTINALGTNYIRASNFGLYFQVQDAHNGAVAYIDYIEMIINYTSTPIVNSIFYDVFHPTVFKSVIFGSKILSTEEEINVSII